MVSFFEPAIADAGPLGRMARQAFTDTFAAHYDPEPFARFCDEAYGAGGTMARDLADPTIRWRGARVDGAVVGYAKLSALHAPAPCPAERATELRQIYVLKDHHGSGIAEKLMLWAIDTAREGGASELYLTVFDHNERAKRFYSRHGFREVGRCTFTLGDRVDDDAIWMRAI